MRVLTACTLTTTGLYRACSIDSYAHQTRATWLVLLDARSTWARRWTRAPGIVMYDVRHATVAMQRSAIAFAGEPSAASHT